MECEKVKRLLPGYLDGAVMTGRWSDTHVSIGQHLERCDDCRDELRAYQAMSTMMSSLQHPVPPADMALRIRDAFQIAIGCTMCAARKLAPSWS
jgi:predicted anti-sigma-YlaC factor YlaD